MWLADAMIVNNCFNSTDPNVGLSIFHDRTSVKCYMADTGLLFAHAFSETEFIEHEVYRQIILDKLQLNKGMFFENIVAQMLVATGKKLFFYSRTDIKNSEKTMEIDFLIQRYKGNKLRLCPLEVKSPKQYEISSLLKFKKKYASRIGENFVIHSKDLKIDNDITYIPIYMSMFL
jgi:hypothetical protein